MATPLDCLVSVYGDTFPLRDIQRVGPLYWVITESCPTVIQYEIHLCTGEIAVIRYNTGQYIKNMMDWNQVEQGRQQIIDARWPTMHKIVIPDPAIERQGDDC